MGSEGTSVSEGPSAQLLHIVLQKAKELKKVGMESFACCGFEHVPLVDSLASSTARALLVASLKTDNGGSARRMGCTVAVCEGTPPRHATVA